MLRSIARAYRDSFSGLSRPVWLLAGVALINRAGTMVFPFLSLYLTTELGYSAEAAGLVLLSFGAGAVAGSYGGGWCSSRFGALRTQEASLVSSGVAFVVLAFADSMGELVLGAFVVAALADAFRPAVMTAAVELAANQNRVRALTLLRLAINVGMTVGPALGGWLALLSYRWLFVVDGMTCIAAGVVARLVLRRFESPLTSSSAGIDGTPGAGEGARTAAAAPLRRAHRDPRFVLFLFLLFLLGMSFFQVFFTLPIYFHDAYGLQENAIGMILGINAAVIVLFEMVLVRAIENRSHIRLFGTGALLMCVGVASAFVGSTVPFAVMTILVLTVGEMVALPFSNALVASFSDRSSRGEYMGLYTVTFGIAHLAAPALGLWIYARFGPSVLALTISVCGVLIFAVSQLLHRRWSRSGSSLA